MSSLETGKLSFPCDFTIKIIGLADLEFEGEVLKILRQHFPKLGEGAISQKLSRNNKYLAFSVTLYVESQLQLDTLYYALSGNPLVLFVL